MDAYFQYSIGDCIGDRFKVHKMHRGGFSEVYLCTDMERNSWPVALKTPRPEYLTDRGVVKRFQFEAERWIALGQHPNIVTCHLLTTFDNISFIVLDWIENDHPEPSLRWCLLNGHHSLKLAVRAVVGACRGLVHAERLVPGIVHGDIKPENILLTARDVPKLTDFGSSQIFGRQTSEARDVYRPVTFASTSVGSTREYAAPEMRDKSAAADCRADVYALGCVLVETCIPHAPDRDWADRLDALQPALRAVAARCLMPEPDHRYHTVEELCADLEAVASALGLVDEGFGDVTPDRSALALDNLVNLGITQFAVERYGAALESFSRALAQEVTPVNHLHLSIVFHVLERYQDAMRNAESAVRMAPDMPQAWNAQGMAYEAFGRTEDAISSFSKAIEIGARDSKALTNRASLYLRLGDTQRAIADLNAAIEIRPERDVWFNRGIAYGLAGDIRASLRDFDAAIHVDPLFAQAHYMKGKALGIAGDLDGAADSLMNAIELDPENADAHYLLGLAFLNRGGIDMAQSSLRRAQRLGHPDSEGLLASIEEKVRGGLAVHDKTKGVLTIINALMDAKSQEDVKRLADQYREFDWDRFLAASEKLNADAVGIGRDTDWRQRLRWVRDVLGRAC